MVSAGETDEMAQELVFKAIFVNDFDGLRKIYAERDLSTDILDEHGMTPLQHAAYKGNEQIVRWLLERVSGEIRRKIGRKKKQLSIFSYAVYSLLFWGQPPLDGDFHQIPRLSLRY